MTLQDVLRRAKNDTKQTAFLQAKDAMFPVQYSLCGSHEKLVLVLTGFSLRVPSLADAVLNKNSAYYNDQNFLSLKCNNFKSIQQLSNESSYALPCIHQAKVSTEDGMVWKLMQLRASVCHQRACCARAACLP